MDILEIAQTIQKETCDDYNLSLFTPYVSSKSECYFLEGLKPQHLNSLTKIIRNIRNDDNLNQVNNIKKLINDLKCYASYSCDMYINSLNREGAFLSGTYSIDDAIKDYNQAEQKLKQLVNLLYKLV